MNIKITINTDNAAFKDNPTGEVCRILRDLADRADDYGIENTERLRDINGNTVGKVTVED